jgi:DNA polymerase sigma
VLSKLQQMAIAAFPGRNPVIKVFGSLMTGLALESSDMDIAVTGMRIDGRDDMIDDLHALAD